MRVCDVVECETRHFALGFCVKHYRRYKKHGSPGENVSIKPSRFEIQRVNESGERWCYACRRWLEPTCFGSFKRAKDGVSYRCKECSSWRRLNDYGITRDEYEALLEQQGGRCAVCKSDNPGVHGVWHIDHDHRCCPARKSCGNCIRGLLCFTCNSLLGMAKDDEAVLMAAVHYLKRRTDGRDSRD